jgi:hypothetical protein
MLVGKEGRKEGETDEEAQRLVRAEIRARSNRERRTTLQA